jgi:hypothetical protein
MYHLPPATRKQFTKRQDIFKWFPLPEMPLTPVSRTFLQPPPGSIPLPLPHAILIFAVYYMPIFAVQRLLEPSESPENAGCGPDEKPLYRNTLFLHESDPGGGKTRTTEPCTGPDCRFGDTLFQEPLTEGGGYPPGEPGRCDYLWSY